MQPIVVGPVVGHTDHLSTRIWICATGDPSRFDLRIGGRYEPFQLVPPPIDPTGFLGSGIAIVEGLRPDREYSFAIVDRRHIVARGSVRTMPPPGSFADMPFLVASCSHNRRFGLWPVLRDAVTNLKPRFLLLIGDQVYQDDYESLADTDPWTRHRERRFRTREQRLAALLGSYALSWQRESVADVLANIPTYMMWDDHDVRDGWGSWASDSPTLAAQHSNGAAKVFQPFNAYFEDARHIAWHCQFSHNPIDIPQGDHPAWRIPIPQPGTRTGFPFAFQAGRLGVLAVDGRGNRDVFRTEAPVLGEKQWGVLERFIDQLSSEIDALVIVTPVPIVASAPDALMQEMLGSQELDLDLFRRGDYEGMLELQLHEDNASHKMAMFTPLTAFMSAPFPVSRGGIAGIGRFTGFRQQDTDDVRDQWSHHKSRPEQERLLRLGARARTVNRTALPPRAVLFVGGDLHAGGRFSIDIDGVVFPSLITSGISKDAGSTAAIGILVDSEFEVAAGIHAKLLEYRTDYNFGYVQIVFGADTPQSHLALWGRGGRSGGSLIVKMP